MRACYCLRVLLLLTLLGVLSSCHGELVTLTIEADVFPKASSVEVFVDAGLLGDDAVTSSISGHIVADFFPTAVNPSTVQIVDIAAFVDDEIDFSVGGGFLPRVTLEAEPGTIAVNMVEHGAPANLFNNQFTQLDNLVGFQGIVTSNRLPEPVELGEQDPASIDFEDVALSLSSEGISLSSELSVSQSVPVDVGLLSFNVDIEVDGKLEAFGQRPAALYELNSMGGEQLAFDFNSTQDWLRNGIADTESRPISDDDVLLTGGDDIFASVDLGGESQHVQNVNIQNLVNLSNGGLTTGDVVVEESSALSLRQNSLLMASSLFVDESAFVLFSPNVTHTVIEAATFAGDLSVVDIPDDPDTFVLLSAGSITDFEFLNERLNADSDFAGGTHLEGGLFGMISATATEIRLITKQAIVGDTDGNGVVDFVDFLAISSNFGATGVDWTGGDFDGSGVVEFSDFLAMSANFGQSQAAAEIVPEPSASLLLALVVAFTCGRRSRKSHLRARSNMCEKYHDPIG